MKQSLETEALDAAISALRGANNAMNSAFTAVERQGSVLNCSWISGAGNAAVTTLYKLIKGNESRSAVLQNYINFLSQQVEQGYISVEDCNTSLAAYFR